MSTRSSVAAACAAASLVAALFVPVAAAEPPAVVPETVAEQLHGLPTASLPGAEEPPADHDPHGQPDGHGDPDGHGQAGTVEHTASRQVETPIPFSMVGFAVPDGSELEFRVSDDGNRWSPWRHAHLSPDEGPDPGSPEDGSAPAMTEPVWVGEARWLQVRVVGDGRPEEVSAHLIDSAGLHRSATQRAVDAVRAAWAGRGPAVAAADVNRPTILTRSQWGADESWRSGSPRVAERARVAFVHHTVNNNDYSASDAPALVRGIYRYHTQSRGWDDIGYNVLVDRFGNIYEGRAGGLEKPVIGAHAGGFNTGSVGVSIIGTFSSAEPPAAALEAVARLLAWKFDVHHLDAGAKVTMTSAGSTRYPAGQKVTLATISGHRDVSTTDCPGGALHARLGWLRDRARALASPMFIDPGASPTRVVVGDALVGDPVRFSSLLRPDGPWKLEVRSDSGALAHAASGSGSQASSSWQPNATHVGDYTWSFSASGRRTATGTVEVVNRTLERIGAATDAVAGAVEVSAAAFPESGGAEHAVVARVDLFADAMAGGPLAGRGGPLLLTGSGSLDRRARVELERVLPAGKTVYVLGGTAALAEDVADGLSDRWQVERLAGRERTATAARIAEVVLARSGADKAMIARSGPDGIQPWADALAGGAFGAKAGIPVLLTPPDHLTEPARQAVAGLGATIVLGGTAAISDEVMAELPSPRRIRGAERAGTAVAIAEQLWGRAKGGTDDRLLLSGGYHEGVWTMPLAASPLAARNDAPLLLANSGTLPPATRDYLVRLDYDDGRRASGWVLGDRQAVSDRVADEVSSLMQ